MLCEVLQTKMLVTEGWESGTCHLLRKHGTPLLSTVTACLRLSKIAELVLLLNSHQAEIAKRKFSLLTF